MRRFFIICGTLCLTLFLVACGQEEATTEATTMLTTTEATTEETTEATTEATTKATTEATTEAMTEEEASETDATTVNNDSRSFTAHYMDTFETRAGTTLDSFTASDPQPNTVYMIYTGEGINDSQNHLATYLSLTEKEVTTYCSGDVGNLKAAMFDAGHTLMFTDDPNRASVILVDERVYSESNKIYAGVPLVYKLNYKLTAINTTTHETYEFTKTIEPGLTIYAVAPAYYTPMSLADGDLDALYEKVISWCEQ